ncbi:phosphopantetheine-binding protein [Longispora urticae]
MITAQEAAGVVAVEWCEVLEATDLAQAPNFFTAGGNSLSAITLMERVEARLGIEFPLDTLFQDGRFSVLLDACVARLPRHTG